MQQILKEYRKFLHEHFNGIRIKRALFYSGDFGIRFNLQEGDTNTDEYFQEVQKRAITIFENIFDKSDLIFVVFMDHKYKRRKIRFSNFVFKQIEKLEKSEIGYTVEKQLYFPYDKHDISNVAIVKTTLDRVDFKNIIVAISHLDFPSRQPRFDNNGMFTDKEVHFININKKIIFNMYDDRGLDIIAPHKETLLPFYEKFNDWILDYDREEIDKQFKYETDF
jgi:hypothetical protein